MSLELQFRALYRLYYKRDEREAFLRGGGAPVSGLAPDELALLRAIEPARLRRIVALHAGDIANQWYRPRVPAAWAALQAALEIPEAELVHRLTESPAFEKRVDDDSDCAALAAFVDTLGKALAETPWLRELLRYERLLACWPEGPDTRLERFAFDVPEIRDALLVDRFCPTDEPRRATALLLHCGEGGVNEAPVRPREAAALEALLAGQAPQGPPRAIEQARRLLHDIKQAG